ncbi:hypothetical protein CkaCkLH20_09325 [Colletotrichum karsti]|uniref:Uncharacterized protein n=1 Tax=Colletotrichum karsti TaxID=1095194 RepID=A0A9P6HXQ3_9PEZI|nr:uncharacterized protein CkaCkLH20_09325 [Colletotrichum karsti]KAF9873162.1 hypothetical protein CkaCkLH20_09325 [Colletotrichum karsti]
MNNQTTSPAEGLEQPPSYDALLQRPKTALLLSEEWQSLPNKLRMNMATRPIPSRRGDTFRAALQWDAKLLARVKDMPRLMREGFHWSEANVCLEASRVDDATDINLLKKDGWKCCRLYYLSQLGDDPNWAAELVVCARDLKALAQFRLSDLQPEMVYSAWAVHYSPYPKAYYQYKFERLEPMENFNAVYDGMPMEGWWPWPKREDYPERTSEKDSLKMKKENGSMF